MTLPGDPNLPPGVSTRDTDGPQGSGVTCPKCGSDNVSELNEPDLLCCDCDHDWERGKEEEQCCDLCGESSNDIVDTIPDDGPICRKCWNKHAAKRPIVRKRLSTILRRIIRYRTEAAVINGWAEYTLTAEGLRKGWQCFNCNKRSDGIDYLMPCGIQSPIKAGMNWLVLLISGHHPWSKCWMGFHRWDYPGGHCERCGKCDLFFGYHPKVPERKAPMTFCTQPVSSFRVGRASHLLRLVGCFCNL